MKRYFVSMILFALLPLGLGCSSTAQLEAHPPAWQADDSRALTVERLWELKRIGNPVISPDGRWIVAPVTRYTVSDDLAHTDLWLFSADGSIERPLTRHGSADGQPTFSPDGSHLAFVSRRDGDEAAQIYVLPITEPGEAIRLTEIPTGVTGIKWVGEHLYFISSIFPDKSWEEMAERLKQDNASHMSGLTWNRLPFASFDRFLDEERQSHLFRIHHTGGETLNITLPTGRELPRSSAGAGSYDVNPDESLVVFMSDANRDDLNPKIDLFRVAPGSIEAVNITPDNIGVDGNPRFSRSGRLLAFTRNRIPGFYADTNDLMIYTVETGNVRNQTENWDRSVGSVVWDENDESLFGSVSDAGTRRIFRFHIIPGVEPLPVTGATDYPALDVAENGTIAALNHSFLYPPQLHILDIPERSSTRIDTINDDIMAEVDLGTYESVIYTGADGQDIQMWVHYPPGFDSSQKYPLFLLIHGGPHSAITDGFHFRWNAQTFASWGYVTAWHNFHGSDGFGQDFTDAINPDWISKPYEDTIRAAEWFMEKDWIDTDRMFAGGASYGGYLSSILLGKEHPFNALLIHAPVYNLYSQMAADFAVHTVRFGNYWEDDGSHFDGRTIYEAISPHYFAGNFNTPALLTHGQDDLRVPVGQIFELFRTLQSRGVDSRLIYFPNENHWILRPNNSIYWYHQVREWAEKYAPPGPRPR
ncbi:Dipeptidyl aminopeptidase/acylaminoacyl peptidase [Cyclonatronum proteinivorum]|uniref:Acyl-peptide hydrolase n=1 Tax=Cyclonatronum proteinivorum TaxID=1457365 RepID=A0A345ULS3_9BACT|nr:S9 family peptidase [Cyclonatronum proteinivorum]AXJ01425.1 Dipeptidyl aminopeptidase/acylaminoacyl peptidase [Cyclonatronum proteinivorum]